MSAKGHGRLSSKRVILATANNGEHYGGNPGGGAIVKP